jgi:hypothetical protein
MCEHRFPENQNVLKKDTRFFWPCPRVQQTSLSDIHRVQHKALFFTSAFTSDLMVNNDFRNRKRSISPIPSREHRLPENKRPQKKIKTVTMDKTL